MKVKLLAFALIFACTCGMASAQSRKALRINEVMVQNDSNVVDEYGLRSGWIEVFNANFSPLQISSIFLTNDKENPTKYPVPLGDEKTHMGKRQHVIFYSDGMAEHGTFHTNFVLVPGQDNWIGIYDADGITLIDSVTIPASVQANQTFARVSDGSDNWEIRNHSTKDLAITPGTSNKIIDGNHKIADFAKYDRNGFGMAVMAMGIVFSALLLLCLCFIAISKIGERVSRKNKAMSKAAKLGTPVDAHDDVEHDSGEEIAAICMALYQHLNAHDAESTVLTINKVKRAYSPWSSKIYGLRHMPK